jgi:hypothetical protein
MEANSILNRVMRLIYFTGIFLVLYWIFVLLFDRLICNKASVEEWEQNWGIIRSSLWTGIDYYSAPVISFIVASALSGIIHASYGAKRFLLVRTLIFIAVFWYIDGLALCRQASMWDNYPTNAHELTAQVLAIICTILIVRKTTDSLNKIFLRPAVRL